MAGHDDTTLPAEPFPDMEVAAEPPAAMPRPAASMEVPGPAAESTSRRVTEAPDRLVFFFSGFDPKGAAFYHRLFRDGSALRNASHDDTLTVGPRHRIGRWSSTWTVLWRGKPDLATGTRACRTRVHFMQWDDLIRDSWKRTPLQLLRDYWNVYVLGISSGVFARVRRKAPAAFWLALFPLGVMLACLAAGVLAGGLLLGLTGLLQPWPAAIAGLVLGIVGWRGAARWIDCEWLLRLYAFTRAQALGTIPALEARQSDMATRLVEIVEARVHQPGTAPLREVLLVGYSTGSALAASVAARALPRLRGLLDGRRSAPHTSLGILTLGHCIPVATDWGGAHRLREELQELSRCESLVWHDYSAPADWAAFSHTPPWPRPARLKGYQASPRFHAHLSAVDYAALRRDRREMHLQYLRPPLRPQDEPGYDFYLLTAGPWTLTERHDALAAGERAKP